MNTKIANRIWIEDPSEEIKQWAKNALCFPNPEYEKKQRMGFWVGRTPRELRLYEWNGNTMILPFGVCRELMPMLRDTRVYCDFRQDSVIDYGGENVPLYDYQDEAVYTMYHAKYGILKSKPGSGKTQMGIALIKAYKRRALWLCHTADLLNQSRERALRYMDPGVIGTITEGKVNVGVGVTFATVQTMTRLDLEHFRDYWDVVIVDECFPGYTLIDTDHGRKPIKRISPGDNVLTLDSLGNPCYRKVLTVFKKTPQTMVMVSLSGGGSLYCTSNHPILTERGYINAGELTSYDAVLCMRDACGLDESSIPAKIQFASWKEKGVLRRFVPNESRECVDGRTQGIEQKVNDGTKYEICIGQDEKQQSIQATGNSRKNFKTNERNRAQTFRSWWKRHRRNDPSKNNDEFLGIFETNIGVCDTNKDQAREWIPNVLQGGHCYPGAYGGNRNRRAIPLSDCETGTGSKEGLSFEYIGVDRVEVIEQTSDGTYGGVCPDGCVYNLEVEGNHNYFAYGVNVHNCHRVSSSATTFTQYERVLNHLSARHKFGLTATPERSDGLIKATFAMLGNIAYEVPDSAVADRTMGVKIRKVETGTEITEECLNDDGTINYTKLIEYLTTDHERCKLIARKIMENKGHSCLILSDRLEQLKAIRNLLPYEMQEDSAYIDGKMQSKKAKAEREQALEDMRTGKKHYLFSSFSLSKEGLDIPRLDRLFLASPCKFSAIITQAVGRVQRTFEGKETPVVYDFVDDIGFCRGAYKKRCSSYRKICAEFD